MKDNHFTIYESRKIKEHPKNYNAYELELVVGKIYLANQI